MPEIRAFKASGSDSRATRLGFPVLNSCAQPQNETLQQAQQFLGLRSAERKKKLTWPGLVLDSTAANWARRMFEPHGPLEHPRASFQLQVQVSPAMQAHIPSIAFNTGHRQTEFRAALGFLQGGFTFGRLGACTQSWFGAGLGWA